MCYSTNEKNSIPDSCAIGAKSKWKKKKEKEGSFGIKSSLPEEVEESNLMGILTAWRMLYHQGAIAYLPLHGKGN